MGIIQKLFGKKKLATNVSEPSQNTLHNNPNLIRVFDKDGREMFIEKSAWQKRILPETIQSTWNDPNALYATIVTALNDGFFADILDAAKQLQSIDPDLARGAIIYSIALMKTGKLDESEKILRSYLEKHGDNGIVLTNLAKVFAERGDEETSQALLWRALECDPNQDNGLGWYAAIYHEQDRESGYQKALSRVSQIKGSWRAQIWLARIELEKHDLPRALELYEIALNQLNPPPSDALMQISGDLGKNGYIREIIQICAPRFDIRLHGLMVGNNLIKAYLETKDIPHARQILEQLKQQNRPDWKQTLSYWEQELRNSSA